MSASKLMTKRPDRQHEPQKREAYLKESDFEAAKGGCDVCYLTDSVSGTSEPRSSAA
jgi:hypothetical protein